MQGGRSPELADLLRSAIAGDERDYAAFLERTAALVRGFARRRTAEGGVDSEDIVQETLLAIHLKRHTWIDDAPVLPWVYAIARFKMIDAYRRRGRRIEIDLDDVSETWRRPAGAGCRQRRDVGRRSMPLAPGQRGVVAAITVEGQSIGETARRLGMTETAVRVALHRGLAAIARRFGRD